MKNTLAFNAKYLKAERVFLREARNADIEGFIETQTDQDVRRYLGGARPVEETRIFVESVAASTLARPGWFVVAHKETDEMLGTISLNRRDLHKPGHVENHGHELELTYVFRQRFWGQGYATEAARTLLRAAAIELPDQPALIVTQSANHPSLKLANRLGFNVVSTFEEYDAEQTLAVARLRAFLLSQSFKSSFIHARVNSGYRGCPRWQEHRRSWCPGAVD